MILGYSTSGFAYHRLDDCLRILADIGYQSVAITLDTHHLDPFDPNVMESAESIRRLLEKLRLRCTIETGARFLLDPRLKHQPTLVSTDPADRARRVDFLTRSVKLAEILDADSVSLWSGGADDDAPRTVLFDRLVDGLRRTLDAAAKVRIPLSFEPEPGMLIERMDDFRLLHETLDHALFGLTLDVGHLHCLDDGTLLDHLQAWQARLLNVHIEDMRRGVHKHLFFGDGDMNFTETINCLAAISYRGPVHVELSRHSHDAVQTARRAYEFLSVLWPR